jgi:hypothetical protein
MEYMQAAVLTAFGRPEVFEFQIISVFHFAG